LNIEEAKQYGFEDNYGNHVKGNIETAAETLGLQAKTVQAQTDEVYGYYNRDGSYVPGKLSSMSSEQQDRAKSLYGYTDSATGEHVPGSLELNAKSINETLENERMLAYNTVAQTMGMLGLQNRQIDMQAATLESEQYWDSAKVFSSYAQTHLDSTLNDSEVLKQCAKWYEAQFGEPPNMNSAEFTNFARNEWKAARDSRLTNPIDESIYQINSSSQLGETEKKNLVAVIKALPPDIKLTTDENGNVSVDSPALNSWNPEFTFDQTNTFAEHPAMFNYEGKVWTGNAQTLGLSNGQKITLGSNFGVQDSTLGQVIPKGNYTVISTTITRGSTVNQRTLLQSEDGKRYYPTDHYNSDNKATPMPGYKWNDSGKYYTKE